MQKWHQYGALLRISLAVYALFFVRPPAVDAARRVPPVLVFPEPGMDDPEAYAGYQTRLYRDTAGNVVQVYIDRYSGRVVHLWADAANESIAFTVRDASGQPVPLMWGAVEAEIDTTGRYRSFRYTVTAASPALHIGHFLLGSMRVEREYQYRRYHLQPWHAPPVHDAELLRLITHIERLPEPERKRHLTLLHARSPEDLRLRLTPQITVHRRGEMHMVRVEQTSLDGSNHLILEIGIHTRRGTVHIRRQHVVIRSHGDSLGAISIRILTDSPPLTPVPVVDILNADFWTFYRKVNTADPKRFRWMKRYVRGMGLLCYREKILAGLPNFATYFGRDTMMTILMMEPLWTPTMLEYAVASVLRKVHPSGWVSHEESVGGQAIRENASRYNRLVEAGRLAAARSVLRNLQETRENYRMVDDDFQLPVVIARYLQRTDIPRARKRAFFLHPAGDPGGNLRITLMLRNLLHVIQQAHAYAVDPRPVHLVGFPSMDNRRWFPGSWRDSTAGYANGRFAMDVNVIWVPEALESIAMIITALERIGLSIETLKRWVPEIAGTELARIFRDRQELRRTIRTWQNAIQHFWVRLPVREVKRRVRAKLAWMPREERIYWERVLAETGADNTELTFPALALDAQGHPIPVMHTDPGMLLLLKDFFGSVDPDDPRTRPETLRYLLDGFLRPYPVGLFVAGLGPLVANDTYASPDVWEAYRNDPYHSPQVVWGRDVNLWTLGLLRQIAAESRASGRPRDPARAVDVRMIREAVHRIFRAVEASGLQHAELWSYRIENGSLRPVRYPTGSDVQLWNLTALAVAFYHNRLASRLRP